MPAQRVSDDVDARAFHSEIDVHEDGCLRCANASLLFALVRHALRVGEPVGRARASLRLGLDLALA